MDLNGRITPLPVLLRLPLIVICSGSLGLQNGFQNSYVARFHKQTKNQESSLSNIDSCITSVFML